MAAVTATLVTRESAGSLTLHIVTFGSTADGSTYASGIPSIIGYWGNVITDGTQTKEGIDVTLSDSTFTFNLGETKTSGIMLYVLSRC